jgi:hypothetical protein
MSNFQLPILRDVEAVLLKNGFSQEEAYALVIVLWKELAKVPRESESENARQTLSLRLAD